MRGISLTAFQSDFRLSGNIPVVALIVKKQTTEVVRHQEIDGTYKLADAAGSSTRDAEALFDDCRKVELWLNASPQFVTEINGFGIELVDVRSYQANTLPQVVTPGPDQVIAATPTTPRGDAYDPAKTLAARTN